MYTLEGKDIVVKGWEKGISDDPYTGIADIRNSNIASVPGELQVNFSTAQQSFVALTSVTISSSTAAAPGVLTITSSPTLVSGMAITLSGTNLPSGLSTNTIYWVTKVSNTSMSLSDSFSNFNVGTLITTATTGTPGDWTFTTINVATPKHFVSDNQTGTSKVYWMLDSAGRTWIANPNFLTANKWIYAGNKVPSSTYTNGNGLIFYQSSTGVGWIFVIHNGSIDVSLSAPASISWNYQWDPVTANYGAYNATPTNVLKSGRDPAYPHNAIVTPANQAIFVDLNWVSRFYEITGEVFNPDTLTTYVWDQTQLLPGTDYGQCLTFLGTNVLIGGKLNVIYSWNQFSAVSNNYIFLAETNVVQLVTVNTNTYIFCGNRGRIYLTNGSNANPYKKIPDHISGTVEPFFTWGGATFSKNILYFGFAVQKNNASPSGADNLTGTYKGLWAIDLNTGALWGANQLSGTSVYATAIIAIYGTFFGTAGGAGLFIGWSDYAFGGAPTTTGIDATQSAPYASLETYADTDMIPVGTFLNPLSPTQVEWKTSYPIGSSGTVETIQLAYRTGLNQSFTTIGSTSVTGTSYVTTQNGTAQSARTVATTDGSGTLQIAVSDVYQVNFQKAQWVQLRVSMSSNSTTPTFNRLTELRLRDYPA